MKKILLLLLLLLSIVISSTAQVTARIRAYNTDSKGNNSFIFETVFVNEVSEKLEFTTFILAENEWQEALFGIRFYPQKWIRLGVSMGIENSPNLYRFATNMLIGNKNDFFYASFEKGGGIKNYLYDIMATHDFSDDFSISIRSWRYRGTGPMVELTPIKRLSFYIMPAYDFEHKDSKLNLGVTWVPKMKRSDR